MYLITNLSCFVVLYLMNVCHCFGDSPEVRAARANTTQTLSNASADFKAYITNLHAYVDQFVDDTNAKLDAVTDSINEAQSSIQTCATSQSKTVPAHLFTNVDRCLLVDKAKSLAATAQAYAGLAVFGNVPFCLLPGLNYPFRRAQCELMFSSPAKAQCFYNLSSSINTFLTKTETRIQARSDQGDANALALVADTKNCYNSQVSTIQASLTSAGINYQTCDINWQI